MIIRLVAENQTVKPESAVTEQILYIVWCSSVCLHESQHTLTVPAFAWQSAPVILDDLRCAASASEDKRHRCRGPSVENISFFALIPRRSPFITSCLILRTLFGNMLLDNHYLPCPLLIAPTDLLTREFKQTASPCLCVDFCSRIALGLQHHCYVAANCPRGCWLSVKHVQKYFCLCSFNRTGWLRV